MGIQKWKVKWYYLGIASKEKDLKVTINADRTLSEQCGIAASKANEMHALIRRNNTSIKLIP